MKFETKEPPRSFRTGEHTEVVLSDCGMLYLEADEQVTFVTESGAEYDVVRKSWGFYATPSMNGRLRRFGFKSALVRNEHGYYYVLLVDEGKIDQFRRYMAIEQIDLVEWLDERLTS